MQIRWTDWSYLRSGTCPALGDFLGKLTLVMRCQEEVQLQGHRMESETGLGHSAPIIRTSSSELCTVHLLMPLFTPPSLPLPTETLPKLTVQLRCYSTFSSLLEVVCLSSGHFPVGLIHPTQIGPVSTHLVFQLYAK